MGLSAGTKLGPYEVVGALGAGGMGEVYKARDTRLDRIVAVKILPEAIASDRVSRDRFEREARAISSLNHPHICTLYDIGHHDGTDFLVMEYLDGETLAARLERSRERPLPVADALTIAIQIADALDRAHDAGIVHRDLKPANIFLVRRGGSSDPPAAKLLDFGLAKTSPSAVVSAGLSMLPTTPPDLTARGTILGTFQYMAPEQLEGREADARTDIFAFGAVVYEMVTGKKAFEGKSQASLISAILRDDPPALSTLQPLSPPALDRAVRKCLAKDPDARWRSAHDLHDELKWIAEGKAEVPPAAVVEWRRGLFAGARLAWAVAATLLVVAVALGSVLALRRPAADTNVYRASIPASVNFVPVPPSGRVAISPDGRRLALAGAAADGRVMLWVRALDGLSAQPLVGTEGGYSPFWSADSRFIAFFAGGKLKKIDASGGPSVTLCDLSATQSLTGTWNQENVILFTPGNGSPIARVSASGGTPSNVTVLDTKAGETRHVFPFFLPDGRHFLYVAVTGDTPQGVYVGSLDSPDRKKLVEASHAMYAQGHLLFLRDSTLMAQPFDANTLTLSGEAIPLAEQVTFNVAIARGGEFTVSQTGVLVYGAGTFFLNSKLIWFDRAGKQLGDVGDRSTYGDVQLSPDGAHAAVSLGSEGALALGGGASGSRDIWIFDLARRVPTRFTFDPADELTAIWSPDGARIVFNSRRHGHLDLFQRASSGAGSDEPLLADNLEKTPLGWSPDGRFILYATTGATTGNDLWILPASPAAKPFPYLQTPFNEGQGQFSPDGKWIAYRSSETGRGEVYVGPFPGTGAKWQVSSAGGNFPRWRRDGKEIFYATDNKIVAASVSAAGDRFEVGTVRTLFDVRSTAGRRAFLRCHRRRPALSRQHDG
jgi:Tol biopolymer transport system component